MLRPLLTLVCSFGAAGAMLSGCSFECGPSSCATGCCAAGICYEGSAVKNGQACEAPTLSPDAHFADAGPAPADAGCRTALTACSSSSQCCDKDVNGASLSCQWKSCQVACGIYGDPCNASQPCCVTADSNSNNYLCRQERCTTCTNRGHECKPNESIGYTPCCPWLSCKLKPGFSTVYECQ